MLSTPNKCCSICGLNVNKGHTEGTRHSSAQEVVINATEELSGYEDGWYKRGNHFNFDMCFGCFLEKFIPWVEGQGASIQKTQFDFKTYKG